MGNYEQLKQAVSDVIKTNGNQEITGTILQNALLSIISTVGGKATFAGIANPTTNPGTPDQNVFYIAGIEGIYPNFGNIELKSGVSIFTIENNQWVKKETNIANDGMLATINPQYPTNLNGYYIKADGSISGSPSVTNDYRTTDFFYVKGIKKITLKNIFSNQYSLGYAFYDENKNFISGYQPNKIETLDVDVIENAYYMRVCGLSYPKVLILLWVSLSDILKYISEIERDISSIISVLYRTDLQTSVSFNAQYQQKRLPFTIQAGSTITLTGDVTQITCRTNSGDSDYQTVVSGTIANRNINFVKSGTETGDVTIKAEKEGLISRLEKLEKDYYKTLGGVDLQTSVSFNAQYQQKGLPFTIPAGSTITLTGDVTQITCRTNSGDSDYQTVVSGTIANRNINFVKSGTETGDVTIKAEKLSLDKQVEKNTDDIIVLNNFEITKIGISNFKMDMVKNRDYKPLKILGIGNSWTLNATTYLGEILNGLGINVEIGVSYAGGATLQSYWNNIKNNIPAYEFHRFVNGAWSRPEDKLIYKDIVSADNWDIITHQQQSGNGGIYSSFQPYLNDIIEYEKKYMSLYPIFFMHATWAYPNGYINEQFEEYYQSNTETMYNAILSAYNQAMIDENIINVMPSAPMVQQVRTLGIPDIDTADGGSHLSTNGQFAVACVWAETILRKYFNQEVVAGISIENSQYKPSSLSEENAATIRTLAKTIVENIKTYFPQQQ